MINQSLFYLAWIKDHPGDFHIAAERKLGRPIEIDWSDIRVICIAPGYKKYDLHAVKMMGANLELWRYHLYDNGCLYLEEIFKRSIGYIPSEEPVDASTKNPVMVAAGKKAAMTRSTGVYTLEQHFHDASEDIKNISAEIREFILSLDDSIEEVPKKILYRLQGFPKLLLHANQT